MRRPTDRRVQNRIQNVLIVCLVLSALFLLSRTELIGPDTFNRLFTSNAYITESTNASQTSAQLPVHIAVRTGGVCQAWTGETRFRQRRQNRGRKRVPAGTGKQQHLL